MRLNFYYVPVPELDAAVAFYRDVLGLVESWRAGDDTVAFALEGAEVELMVGLDLPTHQFSWFAGPMFEVDDVEGWRRQHPDVPVAGPMSHTPPVHVLPCRDHSGNGFYVYELDSMESSSRSV